MKNGGVLKNIAMDWNRLTVTKKKASVVCSECFFSSYKFVQSNNMANIGGSLGTDPYVLCCYMCTAVWQETNYGFKKNFQNLLCSPVSQKVEYNMQANGFIKYYCICLCIRCGYWPQNWPWESCTCTAFRTKYSLIFLPKTLRFLCTTKYDTLILFSYE